MSQYLYIFIYFIVLFGSNFFSSMKQMLILLISILYMKDKKD
ncbi:MAG: hypothetical protein ETSY2_46470 [Candidatus Entotheonella gemina]|uniref:Uncharacterized protein n=1 Tax=Candidatus Entotheonella gemina TaxID=1429439 RepID=W4LEQ2_9BACT|nr:MAG: hypothetical protein ETSY2_46470 [Candidatus Entotheonella gemina]